MTVMLDEESKRPSSLWLDQALPRKHAASSRLTSDLVVDVAIIGGGYVGLWTAIELKDRNPDLDVAIIEKDVCGSGASGRNGGYALSWWPRAASLIQKWGADTAADMIGRTEQAIGDIETFCRDEGIAAEFTRCGWVWGAVSDHQNGGWLPAVEACEKIGVGDFEQLSKTEAKKRSGTNSFVGAVFDKTAALLHPGHLVRGLREAALRRGVQIFEHTEVVQFDRSRPVVLQTATAKITAETAVLATNAWAANVRELSRSIVVVTSDMIASSPIAGRLKAAGWHDGAGVNDSRQMVNYVRTTADGRILAGKGGLATGYGGQVTNRLFRSEKRAKIVQRNFADLYPEFSDIAMERSWSGPVDRSADGLPMLGSLPGHDNILFGVGWSGNGLGPSRIGGRVLASLAMRESDEWTNLPIVTSPNNDLPPEPIRFTGSHLVRAAVRSKDESESADKAPGRIVDFIAGLAPRGVEDQ